MLNCLLGLATFTNQRGCPIQQAPKEENAEILKQKAAKSALRSLLHARQTLELGTEKNLLKLTEDLA